MSDVAGVEFEPPARQRGGRHLARRRGGRPPARLRGAVTGALSVLCLLLGAAMLVPVLLGYRVYVIDGGSMTGTIDRGSLVYDRLVPVDRLRVGDIITYLPPPGTQARRQLITHRIIWIGHLADGRLVFRTKGDHNPVADPWRFLLPGPRQAVVAFHIPDIGYAYALLSIRWVRILLIGLPALAIASAILASEWTWAGEQLRRRASGARADGQRATDNPQKISADSIVRYLGAYSQSTDPNHLGGYADAAGGPACANVPVASGSDFSLAVNLGGVPAPPPGPGPGPGPGSQAFNRAFTLLAANPLPSALKTITVTISSSASWLAAGIASLGTAGTGTASVSIGAGMQDQVNLSVDAQGLNNNTTYRATLTITVTFPGNSSAFLSYGVPVTLYVGPGCGSA
jgi:signal peptidase